MLFTLIVSFALAGLLGLPVADLKFSRSVVPGGSEAQVAAAAPTRINPNNLGPKITARGAAAVDMASDQVLWGLNVDRRYPIASISKLMTALVFLESGAKLDQVVTMVAADETIGGTQYLARGEQIMAQDILYTSLIASANNATEALARASGLARDEFITRMNAKARELGMWNANFVEPTGLKFSNIASARDVALLLKAALGNPVMADAIQRRTYDFTSVSGQAHRIFNTNALLGSYLDVTGGKTGHNSESLYNLVSSADGPDGQQLVAVVLGSETIESRFQEVKALIDWALTNYKWSDVKE